MVKAVARARIKKQRFHGGAQRKAPYKPQIAERYTEYFDHIANTQGISRHKAMVALLDLGIAAYERMIPPT